MATAQRSDNSFATLFKKYRLRSEIETLSQFGDLLAQEGLTYESSLFTHWQKGDRTPSDRTIVFKIIQLFAKRKGIRTLDEADSLFISLGMSHLSREESEVLRSHLHPRLSRIESKKALDTSVERSSELQHVTLPNTAATLLTGFYVALSLWWIFLMIYGLKSSPLNLAYAFAFGLIPLVGGIAAFVMAYRSSVIKPSMRRAILFLSSGLIAWGAGQFIWSIYNFVLKIEIPYPALSDIGFILSWPQWGIGLYYLARATRAYNRPRTKNRVAILAGAAVVTTLTMAYLLVGIAKGGRLISSPDMVRTFFDLAYPLFDILIITEALLLYGTSFRYLRGLYKTPVYILLIAVLINFIGDFGFTYGISTSTFYNASWVDFAFTTSLYLMAMSVFRLIALENRKYLTAKEQKLIHHHVEEYTQPPYRSVGFDMAAQWYKLDKAIGRTKV